MSFDTPPDSEDEETPDWLKNLGSEEPESDAAKSTNDSDNKTQSEGWLESNSTGDENNAPDWLANIQGSESANDLPGKRSGIPATDDDSSNWLENIRSKESNKSEIPVDKSADYIDRINLLKAEDNSPDQEGGSVETDWLSGLGGENQADPQDDDNQDWLAGIIGKTKPDPAQELPSKATEKKGSQPSPDPLIENEKHDSIPEETPEWLNELEERKTGELAITAGLHLAEEEDDGPPTEEAPDWVKDSGSLSGAFSTPPEEAEENKGLPNWLSDAGNAEETTPKDEKTAFVTDTLRDGNIEKPAERIEENPQSTPVEPEKELGEVPSWLSDLQESAPDIGMQEDISDFEQISGALAFTDAPEDPASILDPTDLPDWLSEAGVHDLAPDEELPESPPVQLAPIDSGVDIAPGDLPSWLKAMRPTGLENASLADFPAIPPATGETISGSEESIGPLAGLVNVLPAEPGAVQFGQSLPHSIGLNITETQKSHVSVLQEMIMTEAEASPVNRRSVEVPQRALRWIIAALLYFLIFISIFIRSEGMPFPDPLAKPEGIRATTDLVNTLPSGAPVLLAFEYRPGLSGELEAASVAMIDNLITRGAQLILLSTQPTGPGLGERFLQNTQSHHLYITNPENSYKNLGYLSGIGAGLTNFSDNPQATILLTNEDGTSVWDQPPLFGINNIRDFAMVIVITDDADIARVWIEQVQPHLVDPSNKKAAVPLVMVVSAQAEPFVRPYFESSPRQVNGLISGIKGGAQYESGLSNNLAREYWDSYNIGIALTIVIIIIGSLFNLSRAFLSSRKKARTK
ncbi:MAG: hypothetical protein N2D54_11005 [Chloroflexota bacterium]